MRFLRKGPLAQAQPFLQDDQAADIVRSGTVGLRARRLRSAFSALGVCIGVAAIVGVLGVSQSSQADLLAQIDRLGTNLLTVENQRSFNGSEGRLPFEAPAMIGIVPGVEGETPTAQLAGGVYRTDLVPSYLGSGVNLRATELSLLGTVQGRLSAGFAVNPAAEQAGRHEFQ